MFEIEERYNLKPDIRLEDFNPVMQILSGVKEPPLTSHKKTLRKFPLDDELHGQKKLEQKLQNTVTFPLPTFGSAFCFI